LISRSLLVLKFTAHFCLNFELQRTRLRRSGTFGTIPSKHTFPLPYRNAVNAARMSKKFGSLVTNTKQTGMLVLN